MGRYKNLEHHEIFTAGDTDQFFKYIFEKKISCNMRQLTDTFSYIFNKFKKGIFVHIENGKLICFLPFSKQNYTNDWYKLITTPDMTFFKHITEMGNKLNGTNYTFDPKKINKFSINWYANNAIVRTEYPIIERETNVLIFKEMLENVCKAHKIKTISFFLNKRDFPILTKNGTEPYFHIFGNNVPIEPKPENFLPIFSVCTSVTYSDIAFPTQDDWKNREYDIPITEWENKKSKCIFRGSSTGWGTDESTNPRLAALHLGHQNPDILDVGITKWNLRPRVNNGKLKTLVIKNNYTLADNVSYDEQSKYKYVLHIDGHVSAFRLSMLLKFGSCVLICKSDIGDGTSNEWKLWFSDMLIPFDIKTSIDIKNYSSAASSHYIPVKSDLSDLIFILKWCTENDDTVRLLAENARQFAKKNLQTHHITMYIANLLNKNCNKMENIEEKPDQIKWNSLNLQYNFQKRFAWQNCFNNRLYDATHLNYILDAKHHIPLKASNGRYMCNFLDTLLRNTAVRRSKKLIETLVETKTTIIKMYSIQHNQREYKVIRKTNKWNHPNTEIFNEYMIGIKCINNVLQTVPNFCYTFSYFPEIHDHADQMGLHLEYIEGDTLKVNLKTKFNNHDKPLKIFYEILIQIICALDVAQQKYCFIHNDLTPWNCIIQYLEQPTIISYPKNSIYNSNIFSIVTKHVPVMIDYGKSHCSVGYTNNSYPIHFGITNQYNPLVVQDLFSFVVLSCYEMLHFIQDDDLLFLLNFFTKETMHSRQDALIFLHKYKNYTNITQAFTKTFFDTTELKNHIDPITLLDYLKPKIISNKIAVKTVSNDINFQSESVQKIVSPFQYNETVSKSIFQCTLPQSDNILESYYILITLTNFITQKKGREFINTFYRDILDEQSDVDVLLHLDREYKDQIIKCSSLLKFADIGSDIKDDFFDGFLDSSKSSHVIKANKIKDFISDPTILIEHVQRQIPIQGIKSKIGCANINTLLHYKKYIDNQKFFNKFLSAQDEHMPNVRRELNFGIKMTHWIWFIFPQLKGLGKSEKSMLYGLDINEAQLFFWHPELGYRLQNLSELVLENYNPKMFSEIDLLKFKSCMTLFSYVAKPIVGRQNIFDKILKNIFNNERDEYTIMKLI